MGGGGSLDRRRFIRLGLLAAAAVPLGCLDSPSGPDPGENGLLQTRWKPPTGSLEPGLYALGLGSSRDGFIRIPAGYAPGVAAPLALLLHGAGQSSMEWEGGFPIFDELGMIALAVDSRAGTWDLVRGGFGPDVRFIDQALARAFDRCNVEASRIAIAGFSDGASYALSLGLTNGDLFTHVLGFSPGFMATDGTRGKPPVFLSHGSSDPVLPVSFTRDLVSYLKTAGHRVVYNEFDGGHMIPYAVGRQGFRWFVEPT